jgi:hypothetical protein
VLALENLIVPSEALDFLSKHTLHDLGGGYSGPKLDPVNVMWVGTCTTNLGANTLNDEGRAGMGTEWRQANVH